MKDFVLTKPVLLVTFNRLDYLTHVWDEVAKAKPPRLYLASDGPRPKKVSEPEKVQAVRDWMLSHVDWPCEVKTRFLEVNSGGCGPGVSGAVSWFFSQEKDGIILEDDCVPSQTFFRYSQECLDRYADDKRVWHVGGTGPFVVDIPETYWFGRTMMCWGWASWADRWNNNFSMKIKHLSHKETRVISDDPLIRGWWRSLSRTLSYGRIETWDYMWSIAILIHGGLCVIPKRNLIMNIGDVGVHYNAESGGIEHTPAVDFDSIVHPKSIGCNEELSARLMGEVLLGHSRAFWHVKLFIENSIPMYVMDALKKVTRRIRHSV